MAEPLIERLILGTARLTGGASEREALRLVRTALDSGITQIDSAPSYGMGTAEAVIGKALRQAGASTVKVTAKLGSARDPHGFAKSVLRRTKRAFGGSRSAPFAGMPALPEPLTMPSGNNFSIPAMRQSLELSRERLGRVDALLLHDVTAAEVTDELLQDLAELSASIGAESGYASRACRDAGLDSRFPAGSLAQFAISPEWLAGQVPELSVRLPYLHSLVQIGSHCRTALPGFAERLETAARIVGARDPDTARIAVLYAAAGEFVPAARLLVASSHCDRLSEVLGVIESIDRAGSAPEIARVLAAQPG